MIDAAIPAAPYVGYKGLPPLAGVCSMEDALVRGLTVDESVSRLKRFHYALKRLHGIFTPRLTAEPIYELKTAFSRHAYLAAESVAALRKRVGEMREPPLGLDEVPHPALEIFFDEILCSALAEELILGLYAHAIPALAQSLERYVADTNPLADAPSVRVVRIARFELEEIERYGEQAIACLVPDRAKFAEWEQFLDSCLAAAGGLDGTSPASDDVPDRTHSATPYQYDPVPRRDERFVDPYNGGVDPEAFLYDQRFSPRDKTVMMYYKRLREIDVPEMMASIIHQTPDQPWGYYLDMTRQLWDEARHSMMGEVGFASLGLDWSKIPVNFTWSLNLNTQLDPAERHAVLFFIEQSLMPKTGKRYEWEVAKLSGDPLSAVFQDFDWADEVLHAAIGRNWYVKDFRDLQASLDYGEKCWNQVMIRFGEYREQGLTQHANWWPEIYRQACATWQVEPDPQALDFKASYEEVDDLKGHLGVGAKIAAE
ncbi:MAG: hypothetical protein WD066_04985 [Planctomycetaceae bacterium]